MRSWKTGFFKNTAHILSFVHNVVTCMHLLDVGIDRMCMCIGRLPFSSCVRIPYQSTRVTVTLISDYHLHRLAYPKLTWGLPSLSLTTNSSWLPWGRVAMPLYQPCDASTPHFIKILFSTNSDVVNEHDLNVPVIGAVWFAGSSTSPTNS